MNSNIVPARTASAPFTKSYGPVHLSHNTTERVQPPPSIPMPTAPFKARASPVVPNAPASLSTPPTAPAAVAPVAPSAAVPTPTISSPPAQSSAAEGKPRNLAELDPVWGTAMNTATDEAGEEVMKWAKEIWDTLRLDIDRPEHLFENRRLDGLFGGQPAGSTKRHLLVKERTLPHQVMGILSRVTPDNYDAIERELLNLPIRQSEDGEIAEIVSVFFKKAIRPEDSIYAPQYARLIQALVKDIEVKEKAKAKADRSVAKVIRSAIVNRCKAQYENLPELEELQKEAHRTDDPEVEGRRRDLMAKLKANIGFLGQLFAHGLIIERVVISVLYSLLWGQNSDNSRVLQDYEIEQFFTLLEVCGPKLTQESRDQYQGHYISTLAEIAEGSRHTTRTKVLALNCKEFIENGYVRRGKKSGPMKLDEYNRQAAEQQVRDLDQVAKQLRYQQQQAQAAQQAAQQQAQAQQHAPGSRSVLRGRLASPNGAAPTYGAVPRGQQQAQQPPQPQPMSLDAFKKNLDDAMATSPIVLPDLKAVPAGAMTSYFTEWAYRFMTAKKWEEQRHTVGSVLRVAVQNNVLDRDQVATIARTLGQRAIPDCDDIPLIFDLYCEIIEAAVDVFGYICYNNLLRDVCTFRPTVSFLNIKRCVTAVIKRSPERLGDQAAATAGSKLTTPVTAVTTSQEFPVATASRVHLMPHLLRFVGYTSNDVVPTVPSPDDEPFEEDSELVAEREEQDVLEVVLPVTSVNDDDGDVEMLTYINYMSICAVNEDGIEMVSGKDAKQRAQSILPESVKADKLSNSRFTYTARKVFSATFIFARLNKKLLETLMGVVAKVATENAKIDHCSALLMELYSTWLELDNKPSTALDTALEAVFNVQAQLANSTAGEILLAAIDRNNHREFVPLFLKRRNGK